MKITRKEKQVFWDYDLNKMDLTNPKVLIWFLSRKVKFGDLSGIKKPTLKKYLPKLEISPSLRQLLNNFFDA